MCASWCARRENGAHPAQQLPKGLQQLPLTDRPAQLVVPHALQQAVCRCQQPKFGCKRLSGYSVEDQTRLLHAGCQLLRLDAPAEV